MGSLLWSSTRQSKGSQKSFWKGVAVAPPMACWLPECWYDQSFGNMVWVEAIFSVAGWRGRGRGEKGCSSGREGAEGCYRYITWIVGSGPLLVTGTRANLS